MNDYELVAFDEDDYNRHELRRFPDRYEMHQLRPKVGGGWYTRNVITCVAPPPDPQEGDPCPACGRTLLWDAGEKIVYCTEDYSHG